nr:sulfatase [Rubellimicrobium arenae]
MHLALIQPNHPGALTWGALTLVPLELPVLTLGLAALGERGRGRRALRWGLGSLLAAIITLKFADLGTTIAFGRMFDPLTDMQLVPAGLRLLHGIAGPWITLGLLAGLGLALMGTLAALVWALGVWAALGLAPRGRWIAGLVAANFAMLAISETGLHLGAWRGINPPGSAFTTRVAAEHVRDLARSRAAFADFAQAARRDPYAGRDDLFDRLGTRDLIVIFVESYGRASFDNALYAPTHMGSLREAEGKLRRAGLASLSGWLVSPVEGGQSWLAHATLASGLRISDQRRYGALLASPRRTLWHLGAASGRHPAAVEPAIVLPWPEGGKLGFRTQLNAAKLGYEGPPFNWVTMPDQYVLSAFRDRIGPQHEPLFVEIALISSHAPWTPVPRLVPWTEVGDGRIFADQASAGPSPEEVWADEARVRDQYRRSLDYSLRTVMDWAALAPDPRPLLLVLGDHPPAGFVSGIEGSDVPMHLIGPPDLIAAFKGWGWTPGLVPAGDVAPWPMEEVRDHLVEALTTSGPR